MGVLVNEEEGRLRALWRLILAGLAVSVTTLALSQLFLPLFRLLFPGQLDASTAIEGGYIPPVILLPGTMAALCGALISTWVATVYLDRRRFSDIGLRTGGAWWTDLAVGLVVGTTAIAAVFAIEVGAGWVNVTGFGPVEGEAAFVTELWMVVVALAAVGFYEELLMRGYALTNISEGFNSRGWDSSTCVYAGLVVSSLVFALPHMYNPNASLWGVANIFASGVLTLGLGYVLTGRLALPIGLHISWNFAQGFLFGLPTSGGTLGRYPILMTAQEGPEVWTGGQFGLEGGLLGTIAIVAACAMVLAWVRWRDGEISIHESIAWPPREVREEGDGPPAADDE